MITSKQMNISLKQFMLTYKFILNLPDFRGKDRISTLFRRYLLNPKVSKVMYDLRMELDPLEWLQIDLIRFGNMEPLTSRLYEKILIDGDVYIDVGAHVGFHTLVARHLIGQKGYVFAIDPQPYNCQKILTNWQLNDFTNILVYVAAAGNINDKIVLHNQRDTDKAKLSLCNDTTKTINNNPQKFEVILLRLDRLIEENHLTKIKLLKIDVEGYELEVIDGLGGSLNRVENLIIEVLETPLNFSDRTIILFDKLESFGYQFKTVEGNFWHRNVPLPENNLWACLK